MQKQHHKNRPKTKQTKAKKNKITNQRDKLLDKALEGTFPASDPVTKY